jgi:16S rRNA (uracil1498-N3)-methyltransferase
LITVLVENEEVGELSEGTEIRLAGPAYTHLFRARRLPVGTALRVTDGLGNARWAEVGRVDSRTAVLQIGEEAPSHESAIRLTLLVPTLRPERAAWLVEKATELGAAAVRFVLSSRAHREPGSGTLARLRRVADAALEQCHRSLRLVLSGPHPWAELSALSGDEHWRGVLDTRADGTGFAGMKSSVVGRAALLIGPEGGWSDEERAELGRSGWQSIGLGARTLRVETAALAGASLLLLSGGDGPARSGDPETVVVGQFQARRAE